MEKRKTNQNGITLIALLITIIVLLILAGVSISLVMGNSGVLGRAADAVDIHQKARVLEEAEIVISGWQMDYIVDEVPYEGRTETTTSGTIVSLANGKVIVTENRTGTVYEASFSETTGLGSWNKIGTTEVKPDVPTEVNVTGVTLDETSITLDIFATQQLTATIEPSNANNKNVIWSSEIEEIATVTESGLVTGVTAGTTTITVTTADGNKTAQCTVTVNTPYINAGKYLVDVVDIGTYINGGLVNGGNWRVLSKSGSGASGVVKVVSANNPITYYHEIEKSAQSIQKLQDLTEEYASWKNINYVDQSKGCHAFGCSTNYDDGVGSKATAYSPLNEFETLYTEITGQTKSMKELYSIYVSDSELQSVAGSRWKSIYAGLMCNGNYYWIGGASFSAKYLWRVNDVGYVRSSDNYSWGVRPVVSLQPGVKVNSTNTGDGTSENKAYILTI